VTGEEETYRRWLVVVAHGWQEGGGLDGVRPKGRRKKVMDRLERVLGVARSSGVRLADQRRAGGSYQRRLDDG
jgi:hypothetical protein